MAAHFVVQASGAMLETLQPKAWAFVFAIFVCDHEGTPFEGLQKKNFSLWQLTSGAEPLTISMVTEINAEFSSSKMAGIYRLQTNSVLGFEAPQPQEFVFAIRVSFSKRPVSLQGFTTVPITYLGESH